MKDQKNNPSKNQNQKPNQNSNVNKKDLRNMSMDELLKLARQKNISAKWNVEKDELIKAIETAG